MSSGEKQKLLSEVEQIKAASHLLRGTLEAGLADMASGALAEPDTQLSKFHGIYQQDDRDIRAERHKQKLEPAYSFMIRVRVPGGVCTPAQWLAMTRLAQQHGGNQMRLTTRQAFQFHGVCKRELKTTIQGINASLLDTIAACGDVNRNVMCTPLATTSAIHHPALRWAQKLSDHLTPRTGAYHEIWLDGARVAGPEVEPIYGPTYLPRKFKLALAIPPQNDVDVLAHDLGFIAIARHGKLVGFNVCAGGGMGATHNDPNTYPRLADVIGFCPPGQVLAIAEAVVTTQRDFGDRSERKHARLKYTIEDRGLDWFRREVERRAAVQLLPAAPFHFTHNGDRFGWHQGIDGLWHLGLLVPGGRLLDNGSQQWLTGMAAIAGQHAGKFLLTPNQNVVISGIEESHRADIEKLVDHYGLATHQGLAPYQRNAMACVALPTCGLAMAEAERYLPEFVDKIGALLHRHGLEHEDIGVRITGCANGCARPYLADIGLVGKAPGRYNLFVGGGRAGQRLNRLHAENLSENAILETLDQWFDDYSSQRKDDESFSDWSWRCGIAA